MKKTISAVALLVLAASFSACGKSGGKGANGALATLENVGNAMDSAKGGMKSRNRALSLSEDRPFTAFDARRSGGAASDGGDASVSGDDFEFTFSGTASSQTNGGFSFRFAPKSEKMKSSLDIEFLNVSVSASSAGAGRVGSSSEGKVNVTLSGKSKSAGEFEVAQTTESSMQESSMTMKYSLTVKAEGETAEIVANLRVSQRGVGDGKITLNGEDMTEEQAKKVETSLEKIGNAVQAFGQAMEGQGGGFSSGSGSAEALL